MAVVFVVGVFVWVMYAIGDEDQASNQEQVWGYATDVGFLLAAVAILLWSVRRRAYAQQAASLVPLLLIALAALTAVVVNSIF